MEATPVVEDYAGIRLAMDALESSRRGVDSPEPTVKPKRPGPGDEVDVLLVDAFLRGLLGEEYADTALCG